MGNVSSAMWRHVGTVLDMEVCVFLRGFGRVMCAITDILRGYGRVMHAIARCGATSRVFVVQAFGSATRSGR